MMNYIFMIGKIGKIALGLFGIGCLLYAVYLLNILDYEIIGEIGGWLMLSAMALIIIGIPYRIILLCRQYFKSKNQ